MLKTKVTTTYNNPSHCIRLNYPFLSHFHIEEYTLLVQMEFSPSSAYLVFFFPRKLHRHYCFPYLIMSDFRITKPNET